MRKSSSGQAEGVAKTSCALCGQAIYKNVNPAAEVTCGDCVQRLLRASQEEKRVLRDKLVTMGDRYAPAVRALENFIIEEEEVKSSNGGETEKARTNLVRKGALRQARSARDQKRA